MMADLPFLKGLSQALDARERESISIEGFRPAAVLVPILISPDSISLLFTIRSKRLSKHAGQISFPGGRLEPGESIEEAARRETHEEIGVAVSEADVLGYLDDHPSPAHYCVTPVVAKVPWPQDLLVNEDEVSEVFTVSLSELLTLTPRHEERVLKQFRRRLHFYQVEDKLIWGLTGNVVKGLLDIIRSLETEPYGM